MNRHKEREADRGDTPRPLRLAAAQSISAPGGLGANVAAHCRFITRAAAAGADVLLFPELSLTGYELPRLPALALRPDDARLAPIRDLAISTGIMVIAGAPVAAGPGLPRIAAIMCHPTGETTVYHKQFLHPGEEKFASPGAAGPGTCRVKDGTLALAICADITHGAHAAAAAAAAASVYLAGVLISEGGYATDTDFLRAHATRHGLAALMANHGGPSGGYVSAGKSAFWTPEGVPVAVAPGSGEYLVVATRAGGRWTGEVIAVV